MIETGWVYVITNESMPGLVKVGVTKNRPEQRAKEIDETGSPTAYKVETAFLFSEAAERIEKRAHTLLADVRVRVNREWFKCLPQLAAEKVVDAAELLSVAILENEPALLSRLDLLLREQRRKIEKQQREEEEARQARRREEEKAAEAQRRQEMEVIREKNRIAAPYRKELEQREWWVGFHENMCFVTLVGFMIWGFNSGLKVKDDDVYVGLGFFFVGVFFTCAFNIQEDRVKSYRKKYRDYLR